MDVRALTFDCYGTLIDWSSGILNTLRSADTSAFRDTDDDDLLARYGDSERRAESGPYRPYKAILRDVACDLLAVPPESLQAETLWRSVPSWQPFPDTVPALRRLASRYRLAIVSNIDDDLFAGTRRLLEDGFEFAEVVTAQQVRSYKPAEKHFREVLARLGLPAGQVLHVAESRFHDIEPATRLGFPTLWISRNIDSASGGSACRPERSLPDLATVAEMLGVA